METINIKVSNEVLKYFKEELNISSKDAISIISKFECFQDLTDDEIISVFNENHEKHKEYSEMIELVWKDNCSEMFEWIHEGSDITTYIADYMLDESCVGKTFAEAFIDSSENIVRLSDGRCLFQYI